MARINIYGDGEDTWGQHKRVLVGWFDDAKATTWREAAEWNGSSHIGIESGIPREFGAHELHRTTQGRWVLERREHNFHNGPHTYEFVSPEAAREWLLRNHHDDSAEKYFGEVEEEKGPAQPGRPEVGNVVNVRLGDLLPRIDAYAAEHDISRAAAIRALVEKALSIGSPR